MELSDDDRRDLAYAKSLLEHPGLAARLAGMLGTPIEKGFALLPRTWGKSVVQVAHAALMKASEAALQTLQDRPGRAASSRWHKLGVAATGATGGLFGVAGLMVELPISTTLMLRSVADIARSEGEPMNDDTRVACIEVFALGGPTRADDPLESGYFAIRAALATTVTEAGKHIAAKKMAVEGAPVLVRVVAAVAKRFGIQVTEKLAAQSVPAIGAVGGAAINTLFISHFQDMARGHFTVRRLERRYGAEAVKRWYDQLPARPPVKPPSPKPRG